MVSMKDIAWVTGIIEGEGCFRIAGASPTIALEMTDGDITARVAKLWGVNNNPPRARRYPGSKPLYKVSISGSKAIGWMLTMYTLLGTRRREKIKEVMAAWKASPRMPKGIKSVCHPEIKHGARGLCIKCYAKGLRAAL